MGVSTNGMLFFGIPYGEEEISRNSLLKDAGLDRSENSDYNFDTLYALKMGVDYKSYEQVSEINKKSFCDVGEYCSCDCPMYYVYIKVSHYKVYRGDVVEIPNGLTADPAWKYKIKAYCDLMELPYREPSWFIASLWC